ncbi:MAG: hypothetical protein HZA54_16720 [Planctomycetes bacterium]|nr:hypothetical protein [Planctomycetota bacterium]
MSTPRFDKDMSLLFAGAGTVPSATTAAVAGLMPPGFLDAPAESMSATATMAGPAEETADETTEACGAITTCAEMPEVDDGEFAAEDATEEFADGAADCSLTPFAAPVAAAAFAGHIGEASFLGTLVYGAIGLLARSVGVGK